MIVGITGKKLNGKDTASIPLLNKDFHSVKFAGALKAMVTAFFEYNGVDKDTINRCIEGDMKETPLDLFGGKTTRYVMQTLGTEWGRNLIWDDLWTNSFINKSEQYKNVVCTDLRFPNELEVLQEMRAITIRVVRPNYNDNTTSKNHPSEQYISKLVVDYEVINDGTEKDLQNKIKDIIDDYQS